jgi:hypothetical protein
MILRQMEGRWNHDATAAPEPSALTLLGASVIGAFYLARCGPSRRTMMRLYGGRSEERYGIATKW